MTDVSYDDAAVPIRDDLLASHQRAWRRLARPGAWFDGAARAAIASEVRRAFDCDLCSRRKEALSPFAVDGAHDSAGDLPEPVVDIVHRIATDSARLHKDWYDGIVADDLSEFEYVELVGVICTTITLDTFAKAMGMTPRPLPAPIAGEPSRTRPDGVKQGSAWVPWIAPGDAAETEADLYAEGTSFIRRALSSVPDERRGFYDLQDHQYLSGRHMVDFDAHDRAISRPQMELVAGRVSAINQCAY